MMGTANSDRSIEEWELRYITELRGREVSGARIGDALEQIRSHCADAGQTPQEAFGDPQQYAQHYAAELGHGRVPEARMLDYLPVLLGLMGLFLAPIGLGNVLRGSQVGVSIGPSLTLVIGFAALIAFIRNGATVLNALVRHGWLILPLAIGVPALAVLSSIFPGPQLFTLPGWLVLSRVRLCGRTIESVLKESQTHGKTTLDSG